MKDSGPEYRSFYFNSVLSVSLFSSIKFLFNLKLISLLLPSDYGVILLPLILFSFLDIFLEGGFHSGIIKFGASKEDVKSILRKKIKLWITIGPLICLSLEILNYLINLQIPLLINISFLFLSLFRLSNYFLEAKLISQGFYIKTEFLNFIVTILLYSLFIVLIPQSSIEGFYILSLLNLMLYSFYGLLLFLFAKNLFKDGDNSSLRDLEEFTQSVLQSNFLFGLGTRIDELFAAIIFSPTLLGIFSKAKEIAIMLGTFSSKIISRPWYYVACNLDSRSIRLYHLSMIFLSFLVSYIAFSFLQEGISLVINFLGPNWAMLNEYSNIILGIFVLYFLVIFSNSSLLALGKEKKLLQIDRIIILLRVFSYSFLFLWLINSDIEVDIFMILYLDLTIRIINFIMQLFLLTTKNINTDISIKKRKS